MVLHSIMVFTVKIRFIYNAMTMLHLMRIFSCDDQRILLWKMDDFTVHLMGYKTANKNYDLIVRCIGHGPMI